jgi:predicted ATPase
MSMPYGVVTFLFTDIEGSTRRWEADPDAMRAALEAHDVVLRSAVSDCGGMVFKHTGDGVCAAFSSPKAAVDAAIAAQRSLELPVRMGIATGEAETRDDDFFGPTLNRAARVMSAGHGGQLLIDGLTVDLVSGVDLLDVGSHRLRDIVKPVRLFQVRAPGLREQFPPLKTAAPGNLRLPPTLLIGREEDLAELADLLRIHRLLTLTGVGGVGKTRLALEVATRVAGDFPDGAWLIELAAISDPAAVPEAVASVLGIAQQAGLSLADSIATALEGRNRLLVFDNCEHVLDAAADLIEAILAASTTVRILATSREGLRVPDEQLRPVPSLDIASSATTLFVERAGAVAREVTSAAELDAIAEICGRLDGIPLAIELAASRMQSMTVSELRERLDDRFRLLVGSRRGLERHQTLRHAVQWSYDLLDVAEAQVLQRCSVFAGGFDIAAACAVVGIDDEYAVVDLLDSLVRKSLVVADRSSGRTRFTMLETIRQFAEEQLVAAGDADDARTAHGRYFADREDEIFELWDSPRQRETHAWLAVELANLRAAFRWSADRGDLDTAAAIIHYAGMIGFWGDQHEPIRWAEELIEPARSAQHRRLAQLYAAAQVCYSAGRIDDAVRYSTAGKAAVESGLFDELNAELEASLGSSAVWTGHPEQWAEWSRAVIARRPTEALHAKGCLALALKFAGQEEQALVASEGLVGAAGTTESPNLAAWALFAYGMAQRDAHPTRAYEALRQGMAIAQDSGSRMVESAIASVLSYLATTHGEPADAFDYLVQAIRYYHDSGSSHLIQSPLAFLALMFDRLGYDGQAATIVGFADQPFTRAALPDLATTITHLREVLGADEYESCSGTGERMTTSEMVAYAFGQIERVRAELF